VSERAVVVAPDKFKGSLAATEVAAHVAAALRASVAGVRVDEVPVADGGEGTVAAAVGAGYRRVAATVSGPTGEPPRAELALLDGRAVVELATASGLAVLPAAGLDPLGATSLGTGELVRVALDAEARTVVLAVGGSACTDGGAGLLVGLGARLLAAAGTPLRPGWPALTGVDRVDLSGLDRRLAATPVILAADVDNPLLAPRGAAAVYGPQKGASPAQARLLEAGLARWRRVLGAAVGAGADRAARQPGCGGGRRRGLRRARRIGPRRRSGVEVVLELTGLAHRLVGAELVITGEGSLDPQSLHGKAPVGVAAGARVAGVPAIAVAGRSLLTTEELAETGLAAVYCCRTWSRIRPGR